MIEITLLILALGLAGASMGVTLATRKKLMTELESLKGSAAHLKTINIAWMNFMDSFASRLLAIEAAVKARNPGENDEAILAQLAAAKDELAAKTARLATVQSELVNRTEDLTAAIGQLNSANAELGEIKAGVLEVSSALADEQRRVATNVAVAESMIEGMIKTGDPYNGLDKPSTDT